MSWRIFLEYLNLVTECVYTYAFFSHIVSQTYSYEQQVIKNVKSCILQNGWQLFDIHVMLLNSSVACCLN